MGSMNPSVTGGGLTSTSLLDKIDQLRELGISSLVPLPQMVVVGDQSSGKSSVLESLTGFHFPRAVDLCTRYATEIICRREATKSIVIMIHPHDPNAANIGKIKAFRREMTSFDEKALADITQEAAELMGIDTNYDSLRPGHAFSKDVLRVEISGPHEDALTVIDVPGMFEDPTAGKTTIEDMELVRNMVKSYMAETRTIILAVIPCTGDMANQKILRMAKAADPKGQRTLGILTKPDLLTEQATTKVICDVVNGKRGELKLGYCAVVNRGADDNSTDMASRDNKERAFFASKPWNSLPSDRLGTAALKIRLQKLQTDVTKTELPSVRSDINAQLKARNSEADSLGVSRTTDVEQRIFMGAIASDFARLKHYGLDAYFDRDPLFQQKPNLKLITRIREINELFSKALHSYGHTRDFENQDKNENKGGRKTPQVYADSSGGKSTRDSLYGTAPTFSIDELDTGDLDDTLAEPFRFQPPDQANIIDWIEKEWKSSRGYELGTFGSEMLSSTFNEQSKKWAPMTRAHVSNAVLVVHNFIQGILESACPDPVVRASLWDFIFDRIHEGYKDALRHSDFLLRVELEGKKMTYDPEFNESLMEIRATRLESITGPLDAYGNPAEPLKKKELMCMLSETERRDIHDVLHSYYGIARGRFIDVVCQQVIDYFLLHGPKSPLSVLSDQLVLRMTPAELEDVAGEDLGTRNRRETLKREIEDLTKALKVLRA